MSIVAFCFNFIRKKGGRMVLRTKSKGIMIFSFLNHDCSRFVEKNQGLQPFFQVRWSSELGSSELGNDFR